MDLGSEPGTERSRLATSRRAVRWSGTVAAVLGIVWLLAASDAETGPAWFALGFALASHLVAGLTSAPPVPAALPLVAPVIVPATPRPIPSPNKDDLLSARGHALTTASHELRTPLTSILAATEIVKRYADADADARKEFLDVIEHEARRLLTFVTNVLEAEKLANGEIALDLGVHDLGPIVEQAASEAFARLREGGVTLSLAKPREPLMLRCDEARVAQLLRSLLEEAVRWSPRGGAVRIEVEPVGETIAVRLRDEGPIPRAATKTGSASADTTVREHGFAFEVCRAIASLHAFELRIVPGTRTGCCYELVAPRADVPTAGSTGAPHAHFAYES